MQYDFKPFNNKLEEIKNWLQKELSQIRTGRATIGFLDGIKVDSYGSLMPINQVASISLEDSQTIRIAPWDQNQIKPIEKAIQDADLGVSLANDGKGIRVIFPSLTAERREILIKQAGKKLEEAKISLRGERETVWNDIQAREKQGGMSEDDKFRFKEEMQKTCDKFQEEFEKLTEAKEVEIRS
jgi:ribosome recycling factor